MLNDTICVISTPLAEGAIGIVRLTGDQAVPIVNEMFDRNLLKAKSHTVTYGHIMDQGEPVDEVLISVFKAPKTYTKEDVVEINCHGGVHIMRKILSLCIAHGARLAMPGEFTERAFLNGRIDLSQAEAVNDLIHADNDFRAKAAMNQLNGSVARLLNPLVDDMLKVIAQIEVNIDYPEYEDIEQLTNELLLPSLDSWETQLNRIIREGENNRLLLKGIKTVIIGRPNVGKSSLLNALIQKDKAIVTEIAGTTRDLVEGVAHLDDLTLEIIDTAGIHETDDKIEQIGINKSEEALEEADLVICVLEAGKELTEEDEEILKKCRHKDPIIVYNKNDISEDTRGISISAQNKEIDALKDEIKRRFESKMIVNGDVLNNDRQIGLAKAALLSIKTARQQTLDGVEPDLITVEIQSAYNSLKEILGEVSRDDLIDALFSNFCLGK